VAEKKRSVRISRKSRRGRFIVLDGPDGAGKTTQIELLADRLKQSGVQCILLREPGGTAAGEAIRKILLDYRGEQKDHLSPLAEAFLFQAARAQLCEEVIRPALERGTWVLCDRFTLSTLVYQGYAGGLVPKTVEALSEIATGGLVPDCYLVLWVPTQTGISRRADRRADRMESKGESFLRAVATAYKRAAEAQPQIYRWIDGIGSVEEVQRRVWAEVTGLVSRYASLVTRHTQEKK
jgi:dTMP kinase